MTRDFNAKSVVLAALLSGACGGELQTDESIGPSGIRFRAPVGYVAPTEAPRCFGSDAWFSVAGPEICISIRSSAAAARVFAPKESGDKMRTCIDCPTFSAVRVDTLAPHDGTRLLMRARETGGFSHETRAPVWAVLVKLPNDSVAVLEGRGHVGLRRRATIAAVAASVRLAVPAT